MTERSAAADPTGLPPLQRTARLPAALLQQVVAEHLVRRERYLALLAQHRAPLYALDNEALQARASELRDAFEAALPAVGFFYAMKSNSHPDVSRTLLRAGFGLDVSSGLELAQALRLEATEVVFSGPGKSRRELALAVDNGDRVTVLVDSFGELERLEALAAERDRRLEIGVRLAVTDQGLWRKFGVPLADLPAFWEATRRSPHITLRGLQFHTSWNLDSSAQTRFIAALGETLRHAPRALGRALRFVDVGGGYWPPHGEWLQLAGTPEGALRAAHDGEPPDPDPLTHYWRPATPIRAYAEQLAQAVRAHLDDWVDCRINVEPGRWICHDAMHLLLTVLDKKGDDLVITDAGTNAVGWERFEVDYFPVINLSRPSRTERACYVLGSLCTPHDVWGYSYFGDAIEVGDVLLIPSQGAYTYSLRQQFIKPLPEVVPL